jgi:hypothetical protein
VVTARGPTPADGRPLRDELDLDTLAAELVAVTDQTMQPTATSLWLRPSVPIPSRTVR